MPTWPDHSSGRRDTQSQQSTLASLPHSDPPGPPRGKFQGCGRLISVGAGGRMDSNFLFLFPKIISHLEMVSKPCPGKSWWCREHFSIKNKKRRPAIKGGVSAAQAPEARLSASCILCPEGLCQGGAEVPRIPWPTLGMDLGSGCRAWEGLDELGRRI